MKSYSIEILLHVLNPKHAKLIEKQLILPMKKIGKDSLRVGSRKSTY